LERTIKNCRWTYRNLWRKSNRIGSFKFKWD